MSLPRLGLFLLGGIAVVIAGGCTIEATPTHDGSASAYPKASEGYTQSSSHWIHNSRDHDRIYVTSSGQPLYYYGRDQAGYSTCYNECANRWPPYQASQNARADGNWSIINRRDGTRQWAYNDRPVYTWVGDRQPGVVTGHGRNGNWSVLQVSSERASNGSAHWIHNSRDHDRIFVTPSGQPLYYSRRDRAGYSSCYNQCANRWQPYQASADAREQGNWSIINRRDGTRQWAYNNRPVYTWIGDREPGVVNGHGRNDNWMVVQVSAR